MSLRGKRVRLITIENKTTTYDANNQPIESWNADDTLAETDANGQLYGEEHYKGGDEGVKDGQVLAWQKVTWKLPMIEELNESDYRIIYNGKIYDIESIWPIRRSNIMVKTQSQDNQ